MSDRYWTVAAYLYRNGVYTADVLFGAIGWMLASSDGWLVFRIRGEERQAIDRLYAKRMGNSGAARAARDRATTRDLRHLERRRKRRNRRRLGRFIWEASSWEEAVRYVRGRPCGTVVLTSEGYDPTLLHGLTINVKATV